MKYAEITKKNEADLGKLLAEKQEALRKFRFDVAGSKATNVKEGRNLKILIAQIKTALRQKETSGNV